MIKKADFKVLSEVISPENVLAMAELLALKETKWLQSYAGGFATHINHKLYGDVMNKDREGYVLTDNYDMVQTVAVFLCEHFGERLDDYFCTSKEGKKITLNMHCCRLINRAVCAKYSRLKRIVSLEALAEERQPTTEITVFKEDNDYTAVDDILSRLNLSELFVTILNCRMSNTSFPEIGRIVDRCVSTVWSDLNSIRKRYLKLMGRNETQRKTEELKPQ
ncbi:MAG: hypothetical protein ACI4VK_05935 [Candidatus Coproplasma sp.]